MLRSIVSVFPRTLQLGSNEFWMRGIERREQMVNEGTSLETDVRTEFPPQAQSAVAQMSPSERQSRASIEMGREQCHVGFPFQSHTGDKGTDLMGVVHNLAAVTIWDPRISDEVQCARGESAVCLKTM